MTTAAAVTIGGSYGDHGDVHINRRDPDLRDIKKGENILQFNIGPPTGLARPVAPSSAGTEAGRLRYAPFAFAIPASR
jgi:hypothetical protein